MGLDLEDLDPASSEIASREKLVGAGLLAPDPASPLRVHAPEPGPSGGGALAGSEGSGGGLGAFYKQMETERDAALYRLRVEKRAHERCRAILADTERSAMRLSLDRDKLAALESSARLRSAASASCLPCPGGSTLRAAC